MYIDTKFFTFSLLYLTLHIILQNWICISKSFKDISFQIQLHFCVVFCKPLFVLILFFFLWPLHCLSFYLRLLISPLVSSSFSCIRFSLHITIMNHRRSWHGFTTPLFSNFLFTNLFSIKFLYFFITISGQ